MNELTGARWRKSTRSGGNGGACVEVADNVIGVTGVVGLRDSRDAAGPVLTFAPAPWTAFLTSVKSGALPR